MISNQAKQPVRFFFITLFLVSGLVLFFQVLGVFDVLELRWYNNLFERRGPLLGTLASDSSYVKSGTDVVLVDLNSESWRLIPESWPYSRGQVWARIIDNLSKAGAKIIVFDIQFDTPDARSEYLIEHYANDSSFHDFEHGDKLLADAITSARKRGTKIILSSKIVTERSLATSEYLSTPVEILNNATTSTGIVNDYLDKDGYARRYSVAGFMEHEPGRAYLTLGLKSVKEFHNLGDEILPRYSSDNDQWSYGPHSINSLKRSHSFLINYYGPPSAGIKISQLDTSQITYSVTEKNERKTFPTFSLSQILDTRDYDLRDMQHDIDWMDQFLPNQLPIWIENIEDSLERQNLIEIMGYNNHTTPFTDKIIIIGVSIELLHDYKATPFYSYRGEKVFMPGMEIHANAIQTILDDNYITVLGGELSDIGSKGFPWFNLYILIFVTGITVALASDHHIVRSALELIIIALILVYSRYALFMNDWLWLPKSIALELLPMNSTVFTWSIFSNSLPEPGTSRVLLLIAPLVAMAISYPITVLYNYFQEQNNRKLLRNMFQSYVSPEFIKQMYRQKKKPELGGKEGYHTAFFSDIQDFSSISEILEPSELSTLMNEYLSAMTDVLLEQGGTLDKYIGDAIVAFYGAPVEVENHEQHACTTAVTMNNKLKTLRNKWNLEEKWPELVTQMHHRIGINSGSMVTGNMGSTIRMNYTMLGDNVNLAARLESSAKQYGIYIHVSETTLEKSKDLFSYRIIDNIRVKGKSKPVKTFEIMNFKEDETESEKELITRYNEAYCAYENSEWEHAVTLFTEAEKFEDHIPNRPTNPSRVYIERCQSFLINPPENDWHHVWTLDSK